MAPTNAVIHIVDDDESVRASLARVLGALGFETREYGSAGEFLLVWPIDSPGCLLLDIRMPGPSGLDLQLALNRRFDAPPVVFLTGYGDIQTSVLAMRRGAVDFLSKPVEREALLEAVGSALERDAERRETNICQQKVRARFESLTPRERTVFEHVVAGRLNKQIASSLGACERTVKAHRARVMEKMQVHSVAELVHQAIYLKVDGPTPSAAVAAGPPLRAMHKHRA